jgi:hypothetical protein
MSWSLKDLKALSWSLKDFGDFVLVTVKNEDKLEFSEILEAIKVMQNYMSCIFCVTIEAVFGCFNLTSIIFFLFG